MRWVVETPATRTQLRRFGLVAGAALILGCVGLMPWLRAYPRPVWPWACAGLLWGAALFAPELLAPLRALVERVARLVGRVIGLAAATTAFVLVLSPVGWILRSLGHDPMARRLDPGAPTYRVPSRPRTPKHMERPF